MVDQEVFAIGTMVKFGREKEYDGEITGIMIHKEYITYEIGYWKQDEPKTVDLKADYFEVVSKTTKKKIGFVTK